MTQEYRRQFAKLVYREGGPRVVRTSTGVVSCMGVTRKWAPKWIMWDYIEQAELDEGMCVKDPELGPRVVSSAEAMVHDRLWKVMMLDRVHPTMAAVLLDWAHSWQDTTIPINVLASIVNQASPGSAAQFALNGAASEPLMDAAKDIDPVAVPVLTVMRIKASLALPHPLEAIQRAVHVLEGH